MVAGFRIGVVDFVERLGVLLTAVALVNGAELPFTRALLLLVVDGPVDLPLADFAV